MHKSLSIMAATVLTEGGMSPLRLPRITKMYTVPGKEINQIVKGK
jgi:hypothetical protein